MIDRPIFIVGVDHSGTTILYRMLAKHPRLAWFSQYSMRGGEIPGRKRMPFYRLINRTGRKLGGFYWQKKTTSRGPIRKYLRFPIPKEGTQIWKYLLSGANGLFDDLDYGFLDDSDYTKQSGDRMVKIFETECLNWNKDGLLIKMPRLSRAVLLLNRAFPDALFVRDGKAIALSATTIFSRKHLDPLVALRQAAQYWADVEHYLEQCAKRIGPRFKTIQYERVCEDVRGTIKEISTFCDLDYSDRLLGQLPATLRPTNENRFIDCSKGHKSVINEVLRGMLRTWLFSI